ncbi:hypothetical protein BD309DRAFT_971787 [Dichomitus squalens]|uniref:RING-type E3 ubiquitin transferase n=2 Tax=Dichomitus squalens TaxID=114155 RepID=A0A4Q9PLL7_9APHY|nr:uncharacterized protein DICSQDRAFT_137571 [Dichomitus squalens LYAD-421 SS1]EJF60481.1 hypothetical protein DICSQDRAFT_137571 [Dichomitus squalens LYAD-421 SS1]TBU38492.1 hypothetical protein BD309DRAFT_971787 [Dichomitus squalens]TBU55025.1 hypothetical protein BD310DRAFT_934495 [Dichomitus squalens]
MPIHDVLRQRVQPLTAALTSNRIFLYCIFSVFAVAATIANACRAHSNFYSVSIYLSKSSRSVLVLANFGIICSLLFGRVLQKLFFGTLQPREVERLYDQTWMFVTESLLAFTIFRDEFDVPFLLMFGFLLFVKCFHWLMADRVESMDQTNYPGPPTLFHVRINVLFFVLWAVDTMMFAFAVESTLTHGVGGMVLFASEYAILLASALNAMLRYILSILDLRRARARGGENAPPWENKSMYIFYIELLTDFLKLATYMTFFMIILTFYGLPLNIIRDVFVTARSFITRLRALVRYHNATRDMDRRYPDATEAELAEMSDRTCIICREEMQSRTPATAQQPGPADQGAADGEQQQQQPTPLPPVDGPNMTPKKLPCGHIFHFQCLRSWLERQQSCPTCRRTVLDNNATPHANQAPGQGQGRAARPRPGAAPVPNAPGQQGAVNNPLGWVGRFLGLPAQVPALDPPFLGAQGQFAQGAVPAPFQQQLQPNPGMGWGAPPVAGQVPPPPPFYGPAHGWQHQVPAGQPPHMQPPQLQPPPLFRGFYGPGQAWQPWGDPRWYAPQPQPQVVPPQQGQDVPAQASSVPPPPVPTPTVLGDERQLADLPETRRGTSQAPTPTPTTSSNAVVNPGPDSTTQLTAAPTEPQPNDPRAAATLAALKRRQAGSATSSSSVSAPDSSARSTSESTTDPGAAPASTAPNGTTLSAPGPSILHAPTSSSAASPSAPATMSAGTGPAAQDTSISALPPLIPLYDTSIVQPTRVHGSNPYFAPYTHSYRAPNGLPSSTRAAAGQTQDSYSRPTRVGAGSGSSSRTPLSQLPPTLTDEQLARLDRLTREAIDERLRVLEGVSSAVYRCVEELTRVRSVLPQVRREAQEPGRGSSSASNGGDRRAEGSTSSEEERSSSEAESDGVVISDRDASSSVEAS